MDKLIPEGFTKRTEAVKFQPNLPGKSSGNNTAKNSENNNRAPKYSAQPKRQTVFFDPLAAKQNSEVVEHKDLIFPAKPLAEQKYNDNNTKVTILCVKRKRDESTLDSIVLEEQRPTKRQMTQLADAMQVISLRDQEKQYKDGQAAKKIDEKERKFFRYFTTVEQNEVKLDSTIESRLESLKNKRMDGFITPSDMPRSMDEKTTQSIQKHHQASKAARFAQISKLRNITKTASPSANVNLLELVTQDRQQPRQLTINGLPVVRSKAQIEEEGKSGPTKSTNFFNTERERREFVVDYYVYESAAPKEKLKEHQAVVPVESFDESLMDGVLVNEDDEYDSDDSDDSQNRNRDYTDTPPDSEDDQEESIDFTSSSEESQEESSDEFDDI